MRPEYHETIYWKESGHMQPVKIAPPVYVLQQWIRSKERYGLSRPEIAAELRKRLGQPVGGDEPVHELARERYREAEALIRELEESRGD